MKEPRQTESISHGDAVSCIDALEDPAMSPYGDIISILRDARSIENERTTTRQEWNDTIQQARTLNTVKIQALMERKRAEIGQLECDIAAVRLDRQQFKVRCDELFRQVNSEAIQSKQLIHMKTREMVDRRLAHKQTLKSKLDELAAQMTEAERSRSRKNHTLGTLLIELERDTTDLNALTQRIKALRSTIPRRLASMAEVDAVHRKLKTELQRVSSAKEYVCMAQQAIDRCQADNRLELEANTQLLLKATATRNQINVRILELCVELANAESRQLKAKNALRLAEGDLAKVTRMKDNVGSLLTSGFNAIHNNTEFARAMGAIRSLV